MKIKIGDVEYPFPEIDTITYRESALVKKLTGLRLGQYAEAFEDGDSDMLVGLAAVAVYRSNGQTELDYLFDLNLDDIAFVTEEEDSELPPDSAPESSTPGNSSSNGRDESEASGVLASLSDTESSRGSSKSSRRAKSTS